MLTRVMISMREEKCSKVRNGLLGRICVFDERRVGLEIERCIRRVCDELYYTTKAPGLLQ